MTKKKEKERKGKKKPKETPTMKKWEKYEVKDGKISQKNKFCPRCGPGIFLAAHQNRLTCGKCNYTELSKK